MAKGDPIKYTDLVNEGAIEKILDGGEQMIDVFTRLEVVLKNAMIPLKKGFKGSPTTVEDVQMIQSLTKRVGELEGALTKTTKAKKEMTLEIMGARVIQADYNKTLKETAREQLGLVDEYEKQSKLLAKLSREYQNLVLTNKANTAEARNLKDRIDALDFSLKRVDSTVGKHQRNVGNYVGAIKKLGQGLGGLTGLLSTLGSVLGINTESLEHFHEISKELIKVTKEFNHASHLSHLAHTEHAAAVVEDTVAEQANTVATEAGVVAKEEEAVAVEVANAAWLASPLGVIAAFGLAITAVVLAIHEFTKAEEDSAEAIHLFNEAVNEQDMNIAKLKMSIVETTVANNALTGVYSQATADRLGVQFEAIKKESDATYKHKTAIKKINEEYAKEELKSQNDQIRHRAQGLLFAGNSIEFFEEKRKEKLLILENKFQTELSFIRTEQALKSAEISNKEAKELDEKNHKEKVEKEVDFWKILRDLQTANIKLSWDRRAKEIQDNFDDESKKYAGHTEILKELAIKRGNELEALYREQQREYNAILEQAEKDREANIKKVQDDAKKELSENPDPAFSKSLKTDFEEAEKKKKAKEKADAEERSNAIKLEEDLYKIAKEAIEKRNKLRLDAIDHDLERSKTAVELQTQLAASGQANTLQYELDQQNRREKERVEELERQKKQAKKQEAIETGLAFLKAYVAELNSGKKPAQALSLAATETIAAKVLGNAIAGNFAEGVENFKGKGTGTSDSNIIGFSSGESVVTAKGTTETQGLVTAVNKSGFDGAVDWAMENIYRPNFNTGIVLEDMSRSAQVDHSLNKALLQEVQKLTKVIEDKPETKVSLTGIGDVMEEVYKKGVRSVTIKKRSLN